ncbi:MAG: hypothetical protein LKI92_13570, partial [Schleiferilactobacillus harbinensis]|nr:hypothetical protein [Schleiferilactobacillus harbinensis]
MCTSMQIKSLEGDVFWGRTMDFADSFFHPTNPKGGQQLPGKITSFPRGVKIPSQTPDWTTHTPPLVSAWPVLSDYLTGLTN